MSDELFDANRFLISFPVWVIVNEERFQKEGIIRSLVEISTSEHGPILALFTDQDLAKTFATEKAVSDRAYLELRTLKALREIAKDLRSVGVTHVGIDVDAARRGRFYPIGEVLDAISEQG
jgi:hypothetical protein